MEDGSSAAECTIVVFRTIEQMKSSLLFKLWLYMDREIYKAFQGLVRIYVIKTTKAPFARLEIRPLYTDEDWGLPSAQSAQLDIGKNFSGTELEIQMSGQTKLFVNLSDDAPSRSRPEFLSNGWKQGLKRVEKLEFPKSMKWTTANSAHQVEGGDTLSDWYDYERRGKPRGGGNALDGPDHWNRYREDFQLLKSLGVQQFRMSVEWAKLEPIEGLFDPAVTEHYRNYFSELRALGIEPLINLLHLPIPQWMRDKGGWEWSSAPEVFERFARHVFREIAPWNKTWITVNEPFLMLLGGYLGGVIPPEKTLNVWAFETALVGLMRGHARVYRALHEEGKRAGTKVRVGIAHRFESYLQPEIGELLNQTIPNLLKTGRLKAHYLVIHMDRKLPEVKETQDFFGVNFYTLMDVSVGLGGVSFGSRKGIDPRELTEMDQGWEVYPQGFTETLGFIRDHYSTLENLPIVILENGVSDKDDRLRQYYIREYAIAQWIAMKRGAKVENYCYWSFLDSFEWDAGYQPRNGLIAVDMATKVRTRRPSADFLTEMIRMSGIPMNVLTKTNFSPEVFGIDPRNW